MYKITIFGKASQSVVTILTATIEDERKDLLSFLRSHQVPIASSCLGEGLCRKCLINGSILSCQTTIKQIFEQENASQKSTTIVIDYL